MVRAGSGKEGRSRFARGAAYTESFGDAKEAGSAASGASLERDARRPQPAAQAGDAGVPLRRRTAPETRMNPKVDKFLRTQKTWRKEFTKLREIILACDLTEDLKWGQPCYALDDKNVILMHGFKEYCAVLFHKGALLKDPKGILIQQTKNVQAARQIRFTSVEEVQKAEKTLTAYVREAIEVEKSGVKVPFKETTEFEMPVELEIKLDENAALKAAFRALTPGRQRGYLLHVAQAKLAKTREARVEKCIPRILDGLGLDD
jgi:uncharacterized protein YdeI (YjbR/CyaY-like superfamily)